MAMNLKYITKPFMLLKSLRHALFNWVVTLSPPKKTVAGKFVVFSSKSSRIIEKSINSGSPFLLSRLGTTEAAITRFHRQNPLETIPNELISNLDKLSGFFPSNNYNLVLKFCQLYWESIKEVDIMGVRADQIERQFWDDEEFLLAECSSSSRLINLPDIEPFACKQPWTRSLEGKRVLVIHPYEQSIQRQYRKKGLIFEHKPIIPDFELITLKAVQSLSGNKSYCGYDSYFHALEDMKARVSLIDFDIALIGAGAYGLPLGAYCKSIGKQAVHIGGALQLFFGIMGQRWVNNRTVNRFVNNHWIYPSEHERPIGYTDVEGGCYW